MITKALLILTSIFFLLVIWPNTNPVLAACIQRPGSSFGDCSCSTAGCSGLQTAPGTDDETFEACLLQQSCNTTSNSDSCNCGAPNHNQVSCGSGSFCTGTLGDGCGYCQTPICNNNGSQDNGESGVDCGGGGCGACPTLAPAPAGCSYSACGGNGCASGQVYVSGSNCPAWFSGNGCYADGSCGGATPTATSPPTPTGTAPKGYWNDADCTTLWGWTCDPDKYSDPLRIDFYYKNNVSDPLTSSNQLPSTTANVPRSTTDTITVGQQCGGYNNHGFSTNTPAILKDNSPHYIYAFAIGIDGSGNPLGPNLQLNQNNPTYMTIINCAPPPINCVVSGWTAWSPASCPTACGTAASTQTRTRSITTQPAHGGTACPVLTDTNNCAAITAPAEIVCATLPCHTTLITGLADGACGTTKYCTFSCNPFTSYCNASGTCILDIPWIQTTGGDVHSNTSINLPAPI